MIDAHDWVADELFWDTSHLLPEGAEFYTNRLEEELEAAWADVRYR